MPVDSLRIGALSECYRTRQLKPEEAVAEVYARIAAQGDDRVWIHLVPRSEAQQAARSLSNIMRAVFSLRAEHTPLEALPEDCLKVVV